MFFLLILIWVVPPMIAVLFYERLRGCALSYFMRVVAGLIFAFFITMIGYAALWLYGIDQLVWTLDVSSVMAGVSFVVKYMAISIVAALILPFFGSLLQSKPATSKDDVEDGKDGDGGG